MARAFLPGVFGTSESIARAMRVSQHPPPGIVRVSRTVLDNTQRASCRERSASSNTCVDAPLNTTVHSSPDAQPENRISLSSPIKSLDQITVPVSRGRSKLEVFAPSTAASAPCPRNPMFYRTLGEDLLGVVVDELAVDEVLMPWSQIGAWRPAGANVGHAIAASLDGV